MTSQNPADSHGPDDSSTEPRVMIVGPDGFAEAGGSEDGDEGGARSVADLVEQPAKVMRIGSMIRQLLEEVKSAPLDEASRVRLREIHKASIKELEQGLAPELVEELERLSLPFEDTTPSESELRIAQAQLVGWLEGLFHGIQTVIYAQQMAARAEALEQMQPCAAAPARCPSRARGHFDPEGRTRTTRPRTSRAACTCRPSVSSRFLHPGLPAGRSALPAPPIRGTAREARRRDA